MYTLIANRLLRQFQEHNVQHASELLSGFGQWAAFAAQLTGRDMTPADAARLRCQRIAAGASRIASKCPPDLPFLAGWFIDTHVPIVQKDPGTIFDVYRLSLAPEQQGGFPVAVGPPFVLRETLRQPLESAWFSTAATSTLAKLFAKGARPPVSIRYIGPQCVRAMEETKEGSAAILALVVSHHLKAFPHSRPNVIPWDLMKRAAVYQQASTPAGIASMVAAYTARELFAAVCEYVVSLTVQHPSLWRAVSCTVGGLAHIRRVQLHASSVTKLRSRPVPNAKSKFTAPKPRSKTGNKIPSVITKRCDPARLRMALLADTVEATQAAEPELTMDEAMQLRRFVARHQAPLCITPLPKTVAARQRDAVKAKIGVENLWVAICTTCTVIHRKIQGALTPIKKRSGISACLDAGGSLTPGQCHACGTANTITVVDAVGSEIRARSRHSDENLMTMMVCGSCGSLAANTVDILGAPRCRACADALKMTPWPAHVSRACLCGSNVLAPGVILPVISQSGATKLVPVCQRHATLARHIPNSTTVPAKWLCALFRSRTQPTKRRRASSQHPAKRRRHYASSKSFKAKAHSARNSGHA